MLRSDAHLWGHALPRAEYEADVTAVARRLLGCVLVHDSADGQAAVRITETEAYGADDAASHSFRGRTVRNASMFGRAGHAYVYFTYGMHYCINAVTGPEGVGAAVLIRAGEPVGGWELMCLRRRLALGGNPTVSEARMVCGGPARLCQALGIDRCVDGVDLELGPLWIAARPEHTPDQIAATARIGIVREAERPWRFVIAADPFTSRSPVLPARPA